MVRVGVKISPVFRENCDKGGWVRNCFNEKVVKGGERAGRMGMGISRRRRAARERWC